jgi:hypothetical protein
MFNAITQQRIKTVSFADRIIAGLGIRLAGTRDFRIDRNEQAGCGIVITVDQIDVSLDLK